MLLSTEEAHRRRPPVGSRSSKENRYALRNIAENIATELDLGDVQDWVLPNGHVLDCGLAIGDTGICTGIGRQGPRK